MRVKCVENKKKFPYITLNTIYTVYEGEFLLVDNKKYYSMFRIEDDYASVIPYDAECFEIISDKNTNYVERKIAEGKYKFTHKYISYDFFWSMFYDEAGTSLDDFWKAKKDIYMLEMCKEEMCGIINGENEDERDFILNMSIEANDDYFIDDVIKICRKHLKEWSTNKSLETLFLYLSNFRYESVNEFFIEYLSEGVTGTEKLDKIINDYFNN